MGIPALLLMLIIIFRIYFLGRTLYRNHSDLFAKAIGIGGVSIAISLAVVNLFGSRIIGINTVGYVWIYLAVMSHIFLEIKPSFSKEKLHGTDS